MLSLQETVEKIRSSTNERLSFTEQTLHKTYHIVEEAQKLGVKIELQDWELQSLMGFNSDINIYIDNPQDFRQIHKIVGPLTHYTMRVADEIPDEVNKVWVYLKPKDKEYKMFSFVFKRTLPDSGKCKIVVNRCEYKSVVCGL